MNDLAVIKELEKVEKSIKETKQLSADNMAVIVRALIVLLYKL